MSFFWARTLSLESSTAEIETLARQSYSEWLKCGKKIRRSSMTLRATLCRDNGGIDVAAKMFFPRGVLPFNRLAQVWKCRARSTYANMKRLSGMGVPVPLLLGFGTYRPCWPTYVTILVSRWEDGYRTFIQVIRESIKRRNADSTTRLLTELGRFIGGLHKNGVYHGDLNLRNVLVMEQEKKIDFMLVDLARVGFGRPCNIPKCVRNLGQVNYGLSKYLAREDRLDLYRAYAELSPPISSEAALQSILDRLDRMAVSRAQIVSQKWARKLSAFWEYTENTEDKRKRRTSRRSDAVETRYRS